MQGIFAEIRWRTPEEGGRREPLPVGHWYSPHIRLSADASEQPWSVIFDVTASDTAGRSRICFRFLADDENIAGYVRQLVPGRQFWLYEGTRIVAEGVVTPGENDLWLEFAIRIQSIAQAGLQYGKDPFDRERYQALRDIAAEMVAERTELPVDRVRGLFCNESGYQTPKVDTRAAVFREGKILLVRENNGTWSLPGGWCDVDQSVASNTEKEVREETGCRVRADRLIAVQDWRKHNVTNYAYGVVKTFVLCKLIDGSFRENIETTGMDFFSREDLPEPLANEKCTKEQILMCFDANGDQNWQTVFD